MNVSISQQVNVLIRQCISESYPTLNDYNKFFVCKGVKTDFQFNQINSIAKLLSIINTEVAETIHNKLVTNNLIEFAEIVNLDKQTIIIFNIRTSYLQSIIDEMYLSYLNQGHIILNINNLPQKVLIDFSSPNVAKEMHVGHLRSTIIGESLCRVFEYCGCQVKRINHIGDWGTQFGMLIAYIKEKNILTYDLPGLMAMYKESRILFDSDREFNLRAHLETVCLQKGQYDNISIWKNICEISMNAFTKIYHQLGTQMEVRGESFYQNRMVKLIDDLDFLSLLTDSNNMKIMFAQGYDLPLILVKSNGGFTYDTSDLTAVRYRIFEEKADKIIYVVDSSQQQHFEILFQVAEDLGWCAKNQLNHVGFGLVLGSNGKKLKTRSGETIRLQDLLDQAFAHAKTITTVSAKEKHPDWNEEMIDFVSKRIAINCIKYMDLSNPRQSNYKFNLEKMLNTKGNTGVYLMYALARCKAIIRKVPNIDGILLGPLQLDTIDSRNLAFKLIKYPEVIRDTVEQFSPHHLCNYLYELVGLLTRFYDKNRCIEFDSDNQITHIYEHRVRLIWLVLGVISKLFDLIGLEEIEQI